MLGKNNNHETKSNKIFQENLSFSCKWPKQNDVQFVKKSEAEEHKETCHFRKGKSRFWRFKDQMLQLSSVTNITGLTASTA